MKQKLNQNKTMYLFGHGTVGVGYGSILGLGMLSFHDLNQDRKRRVGSKIKDKDIKIDGNHTALFFSKEKDVDDMIKRLRTIKKEMRKGKIK